MITQIFSKRQTQQVIKDLRKAGYTVEKLEGGYQAKLDGLLIFKAMVGTRGYLVRYSKNLLTPA